MCQSINHHEIVGSFLRPEPLKKAREAYTAGVISGKELKEVEDQAIKELIAKQKAAGLKVVSDGEFRRSYWHLDFFWGLAGVEHTLMEQGYLFQGEETRADSARLVGKVAFDPSHPVFDEYRFAAKVAEGVPVRQSIPAPAQFYAELVRDTNEAYVDRFYPDREVLFEDIGRAYRETILALYTLGCRQIKLDDCTWGMLVDQNFWQTMTNGSFDPTALQEIYVELNNRALVDLPEDLHVMTHICRGNYHSTWATSGGFEPLRYVPADKKVVLGLVTSKDGQLEDKASLIARINEASAYIPLDRLSLSPQCGFASTEEGNILSEEEQWKKINLITEVAQEVWGLQGVPAV